jgi:hypothetical protein
VIPHTYIVVATLSDKRWFDLDAVRGPGSDNTHARLAKGAAPRPTSGKKSDNPNNNFGSMDEVETTGAPPLDYWTDTDDVVRRRLTAMMCPLRVCTVCGEPSRRIVETEHSTGETNGHRGRGVGSPTRGGDMARVHGSEVTTLGWSDCGHNQYRTGMVLDPFSGSGTTLAVAQGCGRDAVGIELYPHNADLIADRCGLFLTVEGPDAA